MQPQPFRVPPWIAGKQMRDARALQDVAPVLISSHLGVGITLQQSSPSAPISCRGPERGRPGGGPGPSSLVPRDHPEIEIQHEEFPPDDARAMSPRRGSAEIERLAEEVRQILREQAKALQLSFQALAGRIAGISRDYDKLERENKSLQGSIDRLTQLAQQDGVYGREERKKQRRL